MIRNPNGQELHQFEIGPYEVGQDLILNCEVSGGKGLKKKFENRFSSILLNR